MTAQRRLTALTISLILIIIAVVVIIIHPWVKQIPTKQYQAGTTVTYTDAVTGATNEDIPGESGGITSGLMLTPGATINGLDSLKTYLTDEQYLSVSNALTNFLLAHSGSSGVTAGIQQREIAQSNDTLTFVLVADRPSLAYKVSVGVSDSQSATVALQEVK